MFLAALLLASSPTAPLDIRPLMGVRVGLTAESWSASCGPPTQFAPDCAFAAPIGAIDLVVPTDDPKRALHFQLQLPAEGARVRLWDDSFWRFEALGYSIANLLVGGALAGIGFAIHDEGVSTGFKVAGAVYGGGLGVLPLCLILALPRRPPTVAAETTSGKPIPVRALGVSGSF